MQEETNEKTIALYIKTGKLTAQQLQKAMKALLAQMKKQHDKQKIPHGKQTLKQLMKQNAGVSNIEITKDNIKAFESTAKKYGIDFALKKDSTETPPRYLVFFKGRDADALTAAFKEFSAKKLTQEQKGYVLPIGAALLYLVPVVLIPSGIMGLHPLASVMGIYPYISSDAAEMVKKWAGGIEITISPNICLISLLVIGSISAIVSVLALRKQTY